MSYGNGIKLTAGFDVGAKTPLDSKSVVQTIAERDAFVTDNLVYEGLEVYVKDTGHKYRYNGTSWIDLDTQSGSESGTGEGLTTEQANQLTTAYEHSQTPHVSADDIPTNISDLTNDSGFITNSDLPTIPTKVSDLENDSNFITSIPEEYITETELETKGYLTEHQSLTDYAKKTDIPDVSDFLTEVPAGYVTDTKLSTELDKKVNKEAGKGLSTNDLTNELVTKINSSATEAFVTNAIANAQLGDKEVDLSGYATVDALNLKADLTHTHDQYLTKVPDEYITETELTAKGYLTEHQDISNLALKSEIPDVSSFITSDDIPTIPTKTSQLTNDSGFLDSTKVIVVNKGNANTLVDLDNDISVGKNAILLTGTVAQSPYDNELVYIDKRSSTSMYIYSMRGNKLFVMKSGSSWFQAENVNSIYPTDTINSLATSAKTIPGAIDELKRGLNGIKVPTKTSDLTNDSGYLTSHQDISNLQPKTDNSLTTTDKTVTGAINELKTNISNINTGGGSSFSGSYNDLTDKPTIPTKTSDLNNDSGFIGYPDVIVIDKGSMEAEVDLDNDIPLGRNTVLLTGRVVYNTYEHELVFVYRDRESSNSFTVYTMRGDKVVVSKSNGNWSITSSTSFIYRDNANSLYQKIKDNTLTTTAKTIPTAINELKSGLNGIKVPTKTSELTNNSGFITTIPDEYITETELNAKGYLTSHQDISGLQTKTDNNLTTTSKEVVGAINELKSGLDDKVNKTDITSTINSTSTDTQIPTAKSVNVAIKGKLITQEDIDTYGKEIIKFPVGKWVIGSVAISNLTDLPNSYVRYIEIMGISEVTNPWTNNNTLRSYKATSYKGDTFLRSLNSGSEAGVIASDTGWQRVLLNGDIIDNLTSTDTNKLLSANQGKILNDTKLNKTDANKLNCVTIDNVSLKEYILTNFTETKEKTYYLLAKKACTDLPKASNFYITVETPGLYTYKVTAKELNDSNGSYVCTYRTISSTWTAWEKVCTTTVVDVGKTLITISDETNYKNSPGSESFYVVRNGICYVTLVIDCVSPLSNIEIATLPKAYGVFRFSMGKGNTAMDGYVLQDGSLKLSGGTADTKYYAGSFSYPVAES